MKLSELKKFFEKQIPYATLQKEIAGEVASYKYQLSEKGRSANVIIEEDAKILITNEELKTLCEVYLNLAMDNYELYYIVDAILLAYMGSEEDIIDFSSEALREKFDSLTDPEINYGPLTPAKVMEILNS